MASNLARFEAIVRSSRAIGTEPSPTEANLHPFDRRNIHTGLPIKVKELFDDGHYAEATFEAFKYLDKKIQIHAGLAESGFKLMMAAFDEAKPILKLTPLQTTSELDEQKGYRFVFAGGVMAIRNPRGHEHSVVDDPDLCLDHLALVSMLMRRLEHAGFA